MLRNIALAGAVALSIAGCTQHDQRVATGAGSALAPARSPARRSPAMLRVRCSARQPVARPGAIIGAVTDRPGYCYARDQYGQTVVVQCPPGY